LEVPISYEGLHEVCALCGSNAHALEACPETPKGPLEVIVEKFGATKLENETDQSHVAHPSSSTSSEKWVTVAPKKRGRAFPSGRRRNAGHNPAFPAPPTVKVVPHTNTDSVIANHSTPVPMSQGPPILSSPRTAVIQPAAMSDIHLPIDVQNNVGPTGAPCRVLNVEPASSEVSGHTPAGSRVHASTPTSPLEGSDVEEDDVTMFLNLEAEEDIQLSSESSKKRRLEEGETSSQAHSLN